MPAGNGQRHERCGKTGSSAERNLQVQGSRYQDIKPGTYNFCRNFGWFNNTVYYLDTQKNLYRFDLSQVAIGRQGGPDFVMEGEQIDQNLEEIAVNSKTGSVYTLQSTGVVAKLGSSKSSVQ